jgi:hypothetical protein
MLEAGEGQPQGAGASAPSATLTSVAAPSVPSVTRRSKTEKPPSRRGGPAAAAEPPLSTLTAPGGSAERVLLTRRITVAVGA